MTLNVANPWYQTRQLDARMFLITEPHVHPIFSANMHLVLGRDADLLIDSGMGVAPLRPVVDALRPDSAKPVICFSTHTHVDHIGAAHEFEQRLVHPLEAEELANPAPYSLVSADIPDRFITLFAEAGYAPLWPYLIDAIPHEGYALEDYAILPAPATGIVEDGALVDLGDWQAEVLHLPGHSPGQIGLWHAGSGTLFGADAIYDGPLIYDGPDMSIEDYAATLKRIAALPVKTVHGGHDPAFGTERLRQIVDRYLALWCIH
ncbi:MAG: MBL fold metallo-hydrolase [Roseobacter sp.]|jgi:glyoxylase-like metal-dependent hydrolase (beta-lactamase superfamily II)|nr:MBL fold metallo-hydrolase [Roseobacter sp.]